MSPGTADGNSEGRGSSGVTSGPVAIGLGGTLAARRGSLLFAARRFGDRAFAFLALTLRAGFLAAERLALTFFLRAGAARFFAFVAFLLAFRFLAMSLSLRLMRG